MNFNELFAKAEQKDVLLERIDKTSDGRRDRYELTDNKSGVWYRYQTLDEVNQALENWDTVMKETVFVV